MRKKVLFVTTRLFWPADSGRKVVLYNYCKGLHDQLGYDVYVYSFLEGDQSPVDAAEFPEFIEDVRLASSLGVSSKVKNFLHAFIDRSISFQSALFWSEKNALAIRAYCNEIGASFVILDMIRLAPYIKSLDGLGVPVVLDYDDLLSKRYERQIGMTGGNILGKYGTQVPGLLGSFVSNPFVKNFVLSIESKRVKRAEDSYAQRADAVLFVSSIEAEELNARLKTKKCFSATIGADVADTAVSIIKQYDFGFVGNMHTAANQAALEYICNEVLPLLPNKTLRVIGVCPPAISERFIHCGQVSFSGRVESVSNELLKCRVFLAPFVYGTGIKTKVLEAMAVGIPVVTNSIGIEGMTCKPGVEVSIGENAAEIAQSAAKLLADSDLIETMGKAGRAYVIKNHDWENSIDNLGQCLDFATGAHAGKSLR